MTEVRERIEQLLKEVEKEAYARGWTDAIAAVQAKAATLAESAPGLTAPKEEAAAPSRGRGRPATGISVVEDIVSKNPGLKGIDIVRESERRNTPVLERTVRSCLARLRKTGVISQRRGKWYPRDKAPESAPILELMNGGALVAPPH